jgi:MOSC domain-containing protein YiiM
MSSSSGLTRAKPVLTGRAADRWLGNLVQMGCVVGVYLGESSGLPMRSVESAVAVPGQGLLGDRYQAGTGEWSYDARLYDDVTLIAVEALAAAAAEFGVRLEAGLSRRNLETRGVDLDALIGRLFRVGEVELRGERPCEPCRYLDRVTGQAAKDALQSRGGLRAMVIIGGRLRVGDLLVRQA